jgi:UDP-galactopyranose mutase
MTILIVGCGLSGAVIAEQYATRTGQKVLIIDKREHIGGNVYDSLDTETGIRVSKYGAHLFHTNDDGVWNYVNKYSKWTRWDHQVLGQVDGKLINIPVNINTVNALCAENIRTSSEMDQWLSENQEQYTIKNIENSEQMAKSRVGSLLYDKIFKHYTYKQWAKYPEELDASVLARIPIRNDFDNRYFSDRYQALPTDGYTNLIENIIKHEQITVKLGIDFGNMTDEEKNQYETIIYTGPIDAYFENLGLEKLEYRSINFVTETHKNTRFYQPGSVVNYPESVVPYTRIVEYKHFLNQTSSDTIIVKEYTTDVGEPYYPIPNKRNMDLYEKYKELTQDQSKVHFIGRLANYKYFNMDAAIRNALDYFENKLINVAL